MRENELAAAAERSGKKVKTDAADDDDDDRVAAAFLSALNARWIGEGRSRRGIIWCTLFAYIK